MEFELQLGLNQNQPKAAKSKGLSELLQQADRALAGSAVPEGRGGCLTEQGTYDFDLTNRSDNINTAFNI